MARKRKTESSVATEPISEVPPLEEPPKEPTISLKESQYNALTELLNNPPGLPYPEALKIQGWLQKLKDTIKT